MYIIRSMRGAVSVLALGAAAVISCSAGPFGREYEYEEQLYLDVDGSATITVDASLPSLVSLRGARIDPSPRARFDPDAIRRAYDSEACHVARIGLPWYKHGRRFVEIRLRTTDVRALTACAPLAWSSYQFDRQAAETRYEQRVGAPAGDDPGAVNWTGGELVAFKLHLPSKVTFHNVRRLADNSAGEVERGNILTWEQRLTDRRAGVPIDIQVRMEPGSILYRTLWLFAGSFLAAVAVMAALIVWTAYRGRAGLQNPPASRMS
jgi:hypothetical protein